MIEGSSKLSAPVVCLLIVFPILVGCATQKPVDADREFATPPSWNGIRIHDPEGFDEYLLERSRREARGERVIHFHRPSKDVLVELKMAFDAYERGDYRASKMLFREVIRRMPSNPKNEEAIDKCFEWLEYLRGMEQRQTEVSNLR